MSTIHISPKGNRPRARSGADVTVYGTNWCAATQMVRRYLDRLGVPYGYRNMDRDRDAAKRVAWWTGGDFSHPTVQIGGDVLVEPSQREIQNSLRQNGLL
jgi:mycoredoxin